MFSMMGVTCFPEKSEPPRKLPTLCHLSTKSVQNFVLSHFFAVLIQELVEESQFMPVVTFQLVYHQMPGRPNTNCTKIQREHPLSTSMLRGRVILFAPVLTMTKLSLAYLTPPRSPTPPPPRWKAPCATSSSAGGAAVSSSRAASSGEATRTAASLPPPAPRLEDLGGRRILQPRRPRPRGSRRPRPPRRVCVRPSSC